MYLCLGWKSWDSIIGTYAPTGAARHDDDYKLGQQCYFRRKSHQDCMRLKLTKYHRSVVSVFITFFFLMQVAFYKFVVQTVILGFLYRTLQFSEALCSYPRFSFGPKLSFFVLGNFYMVY